MSHVVIRMFRGRVCQAICVLLVLIALVGCNTSESQPAATPTGEATAGQPVPEPSSPLSPGTYFGDSASEVALVASGQRAASTAKSKGSLTVDADGLPVMLDDQRLTRGSESERELGRSYKMSVTITSVRVTERSVKVLYDASVKIVLPHEPPVLIDEPTVSLSGKGQLTFEVSDNGETIVVSDSADLTGITLNTSEPVSLHAEVTGAYSQ